MFWDSWGYIIRSLQLLPGSFQILTLGTLLETATMQLQSPSHVWRPCAAVQPMVQLSSLPTAHIAFQACEGAILDVQPIKCPTATAPVNPWSQLHHMRHPEGETQMSLVNSQNCEISSNGDWIKPLTWGSLLICFAAIDKQNSVKV